MGRPERMNVAFVAETNKKMQNFFHPVQVNASTLLDFFNQLGKNPSSSSSGKAAAAGAPAMSANAGAATGATNSANGGGPATRAAVAAAAAAAAAAANASTNGVPSPVSSSLVKVKEEPMSEDDLRALQKDRQKKDNHNMSE